MLKRIAVMMAVMLALALAVGALAQEASTPAVAPDPGTAPAAVAPAPAVTTPPIPAAATSPIAPDTEIFRRTPVVDGAVSDGEWDSFYTYSSGDWAATTYADWDPGALYVGVKSNQPVDARVVLDGNADGWFHGDDNYEFLAVRSGDSGMTLTASRYESKNSKSPVATPVPTAEAAAVDVKSTGEAGAYVLEMRIPASVLQGVRLEPSRNIGMQLALKTTADDSGWVPSRELGDLKECTLVMKKFATLKPLVLGFDLSDYRVARGEELTGKLHLTNEGTESLDIRTFVIAGEGRAGDYLSSQKVRLQGLAARKHISQTIRTLVPTDMPDGCWALGAEVKSSDKRQGAALVSFEVVDPFDIELKMPSGDVKADVKDVTIAVNVRNNTRHTLRGIAKVTLPVGWELWRNQSERDFSIHPDLPSQGVLFKAKPPLGELGDVPVKVEVTANGETKTAEGKMRMVNP